MFQSEVQAVPVGSHSHRNNILTLFYILLDSFCRTVTESESLSKPQQQKQYQP